jgi:ABC-type Zn uptake system ZnuABC Zn-binding protein ZnuA
MVATTSLVADVVSAVAGDLVDLEVLLPPDADPHSFDPSPQEVALITRADLVFMNGLGLEIFMQDILENADSQAKVVSVSEGVEAIELGEEHEDEVEGDEEEQGGEDPHVWMNPLNLRVWAENIAGALSELDPDNAQAYRSNAAVYITNLEELDNWAMGQIAQIPEEQRILVTDHESFTYFAEHYGFTLVGALIPGYSTAGEPSAADLAALEQTIGEYEVPAIFVGISVNPALAEQVARDTGTQLVPVYTESLSGQAGQPSTYLEMMRYDVEAIVAALK